MSYVVGPNEVLRKNTATAYGSGAAAYTRGIWIYTPTGTDIGTAILFNHASIVSWRGQTGAGDRYQIRFVTASSGNVSLNSGSVGFDGWHFFVAVFANGAQALYVDGNTTPVATASVADVLGSTSSFETLGDTAGGLAGAERLYIGGEFVLSGKALSASEQADIFAGTSKPQDFIDGVTVTGEVFGFDDPTTGSIADGDAGLDDLVASAHQWKLNAGTPVWNSENPGHNWAAEEDPGLDYSDGGIPAYANIGEAAQIYYGDGEVESLHDSYDIPNLKARLRYGMMLVDPNLNITAVQYGHEPTGNPLIKAVELASGSTQTVDASNLFALENQSSENSYFGLPVKNIWEVYFDESTEFGGAGEDEIVRYIMQNTLLGTDGEKPWLNSGDRIKVRLLWRVPPSLSDQFSSVVLDDANGSGSITVNLKKTRPKWHKGLNPDTDEPQTADTSHINASAEDLELVWSGSRFEVIVKRPLPFAINCYAQFAGLIAYKVDSDGNRIPGHYKVHRGDNSFSHKNFTDDLPSGGTSGTSKNFTDEEYIHAADVGTLDLNQKKLILINCANESKSQAAHKAEFEDYITKFDERHAAIGRPAPHYLLFISAPAYLDPGDTVQDIIDNCRDMAAAAHEVSLENSRFGYISLAHLVDFRRLTTDEKAGEPVNADAIAWLEANGGDAFSYGSIGPIDFTDDGDLFDAPNGLHYRDQDSAAFFARLAVDVLWGAYQDATAGPGSDQRIRYRALAGRGLRRGVASLGYRLKDAVLHGRSLCRGRSMRNRALFSVAGTDRGRGIEPGTAGAVLPNFNYVASANEVSLVALVHFDGIAGVQTIFGCSLDGDVSLDFRLGSSSGDGKLALRFEEAGGTSRGWTTDAAAISAAGFHVVAVSARLGPDGDCEIYLDGAAVASSATSESSGWGEPVDVASGLYLGSLESSQVLDGQIVAAYRWDRRLSAADMRRVAADILAPLR